jgi:hypothetical protein
MTVFDSSGAVVGAPEVVDCQQLLERVQRLRSEIIEEVAVAALMALPTKQCDRLVAGLLDSLNGLEALLKVEPNERRF